MLLTAPWPAPGRCADLKRVTLLPNWSPGAEFSGYYVALDKGIYRKHGIDARIIPGGPNRPASAHLKDGKADAVVLWLSRALKMRSQGTELVNLTQIIQRSALMLVARKSSGILVPKDFDGKKVGVWREFELQPKAFFRKFRVRPAIVPQSYTINLFLRGGVDAATVMWYNEYHRLIEAGIEPDELATFFFDEYGLNFPEDGLYVLKKTYRGDPALYCEFARASLEGWQYAFSHPDEALDIILRHMREAGVPANRVHQKWALEKIQTLSEPRGGAKFGELSRPDYERAVQELQREGVISRVPHYPSFLAACQDVPKD